MDEGESSGLYRDRRSSRPRRLGERRYPWTIRGNPEYARICEQPGACPLPPAKEITVVAERIHGIPNSPQDQAPRPCVLLHQDRGNERSPRLARYPGDAETSSADFTKELKDPTFAGLHVGPRDVRAAAKSRGLWFAKTSAGTKNRAVLGRVGLNTIIARYGMKTKTLKGTNPCARGAHIYKGPAESRSGLGGAIVTMVQPPIRSWERIRPEATERILPSGVPFSSPRCVRSS